MAQSPQVTDLGGHHMTDDEIIESIGAHEYGRRDNDGYTKDVEYDINAKVVHSISDHKNEPEWMHERHLKALEIFGRKPMPTWGPDLSGIDFDTFHYYVNPTDCLVKNWEDLSEEVRNTYDRLGIPEAEKNRLVTGVAAQYGSEVVYQRIQEDLERQGVIFLNTDSGLHGYLEIFKGYFGRAIPSGNNRFSALNIAAWSGGSLIYIPPGVCVDVLLQAYFYINTATLSRFEHTLIIANEGSYVHYVEGCTTPIYDKNSLHSGVIEIFMKKGAHVRYTTIQNWSTNVLNLATRHAVVEEGGIMKWVDGSMGAAITMKYPTCFLMGDHARGETLSVGFTGPGQHQDTGVKIVHMTPKTSSPIVSKSVSRGGGRTFYRGLVRVSVQARRSKSNVLCNALLIDKILRTDTYLCVDVRTGDVEMGHETTISEIFADQLFYLMDQGLDKNEAMAMIVRDFVEPIAKGLPMEYAFELSHLIELQMEGSVG